MELTHLPLEVPPLLSREGVASLAEGLARAEGFPGPKVLVLRGVGDTFCRGLDLRADPDPAGLTAFAELILALRGAPYPTIALVEGEALGGGLGLAAACDQVLAAPTARLGLPEALFGLVPGAVLPLVAERVGPARARRLALRGEAIAASEALAWGLVDAVEEDLDRAHLRYARRLARAAPAAAAWLKQVEEPLRAAVRAGARATATRWADPRVEAALAAFAAGEPPWEVTWTR